MARLFFIAGFLLLQTAAFPQIDPQKLDSLSHSIDSSLKAYQAWQDSFTRAEKQKSIERRTIHTAEYTQRLQQEKNQKKRLQTIRYIFIGLIFLTVLTVGILRRRKPTKI